MAYTCAEGLVCFRVCFNWYQLAQDALLSRERYMAILNSGKIIKDFAFGGGGYYHQSGVNGGNGAAYVSVLTQL